MAFPPETQAATPGHDPDFMSREFSHDPFPVLAGYRHSRPVYRHQTSQIPCVSLFHYRDIAGVLKDDKRYKMILPGSAYSGVGSRSFYLDPPVHTGIRQYLNPQFGQSRLRGITEPVSKKCRQLLLQHANSGCFDFYSDVAVPLSVFALCEFMGLPHQDTRRITDWGRIASQNEMSACCSPGHMPGADEKLDRVYRETSEYVSELLNRPGNNGAGGLLDVFRSALKDKRNDMDEDVLIDISVGLITAGFDAIAMAMCNLLRSFIEHPEQWLLLEQNHGLINPAVEEGLRHLHPNKVMYRIAAGHTFIHGIELRPGDNILVWLGSANRDEEIFKDPDAFNIQRQQPICHIGFGAGIHACIGAALSRLELQLMLQVLLDLRLNFKPGGEDWWEPAVCPMMFGPDACKLILSGRK